MSRWKNIMKCYPMDEKRLESWQPPYVVQPKYDGVRCRAVPFETGEFMLLSSEENPIFSVPHINIALKGLPPFEYDGELYCHGKSFEEIVSITSRTVNPHPDYETINYHIFDLVTDEPQIDRLLKLNRIQMKEPLIIAPSLAATNLQEIMRIYDKYINDGYEGIIVRHLSALYERKRSRWVMKFKPKKEDSYMIVGSQEEISIEGNPKNRLGALILKSGDGNIFKVGTGFDDDARESLWKKRDGLIGRAARIQYQHLSSGRKVPRFPVYVEIINKKDNNE